MKTNEFAEIERRYAKSGRGGAFEYWGIPEGGRRRKTRPVARFPVIPIKRGKFPGVNIDAVHKGRK